MVVRDRPPEEAIDFVRRSFTLEDLRNNRDIVRLMASVVLGGAVLPEEYQALLSDGRWTALTQTFREGVAVVYGLPQRPTLEVVMQAGLSAMKSCACKELRSNSCPTCLPAWQQYVSEIPSCHHVRSSLICPVSGAVMDERNPPMVSPDGLVFSTAALQEQQTRSPDGLVECPLTKRRYDPNLFGKLFVT
eukprot:GHVU01012433.1.p1 GENE.GHVU01012433.1~~GHVU01012433.1.p1  ORF type:complete len:190 (+),score=26.44 GHVU01012433.1:1460-2029(+)